MEAARTGGAPFMSSGSAGDAAGILTFSTHCFPCGISGRSNAYDRCINRLTEKRSPLNTCFTAVRQQWDAGWLVHGIVAAHSRMYDWGRLHDQDSGRCSSPPDALWLPC